MKLKGRRQSKNVQDVRHRTYKPETIEEVLDSIVIEREKKVEDAQPKTTRKTNRLKANQGKSNRQSPYASRGKARKVN